MSIATSKTPTKSTEFAHHSSVCVCSYVETWKRRYVFADIPENLVENRGILGVEEGLHERKLRQRRVRHHLLRLSRLPRGIRSNCGSKRGNRGPDRRLPAAVPPKSEGLPGD